jgi:hypothetical protein
MKSFAGGPQDLLDGGTPTSVPKDPLIWIC